MMKMERVKLPRKPTVRLELEQYVVAWNTPLKESPISLLRNAHPIYRSDFAYKLRDAGLMTNEEIREFVKFVR